MHPLIRIICLLLGCIFISWGEGYHLLIAVVVLFFIYSRYQHCWKNAWMMLKRMRWFFLSLLVLYTFFNPYDLNAAELSKYIDEVLVGIRHIIALILIILAVNLLVQLTPKEHILAALYLLLLPLQRFIKIETFVLRVLLTFKYIIWIQQNIKQEISLKPLNNKDNAMQRLHFVIIQLADLLGGLLHNTMPMETRITFETLDKPKWVEWFYPSVCIISFYSVTVLHT